MNYGFYVSLAIFVITYGVIMSERLPRTYVAMAGGLAMVLAGFMTQDEAVVHYIDFNTLGLLLGMMMIVAVTRRSGVFEAMAVWAAKVTKGSPSLLLVLLSLITAVASSLFDSVTAVLLLAPMTLSLSRTLDLDPYPYLIMEVLMANIGGTALMIGNPPNVMIGSATGLSFTDFFFNLMPVVVLNMAVVIPLLLFLYRKDLQKGKVNPFIIARLDYKKEIKDQRLLVLCLSVLAATIAGFIFHHALGLDSATIALSGAVVLMLLARIAPGDVFAEVEWDTIFFFLGLFILVGGIEAAGVITAMARWAMTVTGGDVQQGSFLILWLAALASAFVDNIPFTATMIPLLQEMQSMLPMPVEALWWSLAIGACFGGNGTLVGASPNLIVAGIAAKDGYPISFLGFMKRGLPLMILTILISQVYVYVRYFL